MKNIQTKDLNAFGILKRLFGFTGQVKKEMLACVTGGLFGGLAKICVYISAGMLLASAAGFGGTFLWPSILLILSTCSVPITYYYEMFKGHDVAYHLLAILRSDMFEEIERLSPAKLTGEKKGDIISTLIADVDTLEIFFAHLISPIVTAVGCTVFSLVFIGRRAPSLALLVLPFYLYVGVISPILINKAGREKGRKYRRDLGELKSYILDSLRGLKEVLIFRNGGERLDNIDARGMAMNKLQISINRQNALLLSVPSFIMQVSRILAYAVCGAMIVRSELSRYDSVVLMLMIPATFESLSQLSTSATALIQTFGSAERVFALIDEPAQVEDSGTKIFPEKVESVVFDNVSFTYPGTTAKVLDGMNLTLTQGQNAGIMGESGCGKSTMMHMLLRFYDPDEGRILVNGTDIREYTLESLRRGISMMEQDTFMFNESITENIRLGRPEATAEEVEEAAKRACIHDLIMTLPEGYDTKTGELGGRLSGGERQRIGIARTILKDSDMMIFDEPTSNLDVLNEKGLLKTIDEEFSDKTVLMISHRASTLGACDVVKHFEDGHFTD
ncbi:MAG: ABC transporter ATP-binding protein/permease [Eubacteriales bacterium]|nr:ABC transporter ATP-binding protein/permease [Eubacteriales bacterium]